VTCDGLYINVVTETPAYLRRKEYVTVGLCMRSFVGWQKMETFELLKYAFILITFVYCG
jgi:hypothetical protein